MGLKDKLNKSAVIGLMTFVVLGYDFTLIYSKLGWNQQDLISLTTDPEIIGVQITGLTIVIYVMEFLFGRFSSRVDRFSPA